MGGRGWRLEVGSINFDCMREGITISHNRDLAFRDHSWKSVKFNRIFKKAQEKSAEFEKNQKNMRVEKVTGEEIQLESGRKEARLLAMLKKKHDGPVTCAEDVDKLLEMDQYKTKKNSKKLKLALENEISFAKTLFKTIPAKSPLFVQKKNSIDQLATNLKILYGKTFDDKIEASLHDLEDALKEISEVSNTIDENLVPQAEFKEKLILHQYVAVVNEKTLYFGTIVDAKAEVVEVNLMKPVDNVNPNLFIFDEASLKVNIDMILNVFPVFSLNMQFCARINPIWELENYEAFKSFC